MRIRPKLRTLFGLSAEERSALIEAWLGLLWFRVWLACQPSLRLDAWISGLVPWDGEPDEKAVEQLGRWVAIAARYHVVRADCLPRSLCLQWMMARRGWQAQLRIGVRKEQGRVCAHAWLEDPTGRPIHEREDVRSHFKPLFAAAR